VGDSVALDADMSTPPGTGTWKPVETIAGVFGLLAGVVAFVYVFGGIVLLLRLQVRGLRAEVVVATLPREFLVSVGLAVLFQFVMFMAVLLGAFLQQAFAPIAIAPGAFVQHVAPIALAQPAPPSGDAPPSPGDAPPSPGNQEFPLGPHAIRVLIVGAATAVLVVPLLRWIGWEQSPWWLVFYATVLLFQTWLFLLFRVWPDWRLRWGVPMVVTGIIGLGIGLLVVFKYPEDQVLKWLVGLLGVVPTAVALWFLLAWITDSGESARPLLRRAGLLTLVAFLIFLPWRWALEVASIEALEVLVCTSEKPPEASGKPSIAGLYIGENDSSVYIGEDTKDSPRIAEIPRDQITRFFLGKNAKEASCPEIPDAPSGSGSSES